MRRSACCWCACVCVIALFTPNLSSLSAPCHFDAVAHGHLCPTYLKCIPPSHVICSVVVAAKVGPGCPAVALYLCCLCPCCCMWLDGSCTFGTAVDLSLYPRTIQCATGRRERVHPDLLAYTEEELCRGLTTVADVDHVRSLVLPVPILLCRPTHNHRGDCGCMHRDRWCMASDRPVFTPTLIPRLCHAKCAPGSSLTRSIARTVLRC